MKRNLSQEENAKQTFSTEYSINITIKRTLDQMENPEENTNPRAQKRICVREESLDKNRDWNKTGILLGNTWILLEALYPNKPINCNIKYNIIDVDNSGDKTTFIYLDENGNEQKSSYTV